MVNVKSYSRKSKTGNIHRVGSHYRKNPMSSGKMKAPMKPKMKELDKPTYQPFEKVVRIGTTKMNGTRGSVYAKIEFNEKGNLSISGVEAPLPSGNARGSVGQIDGGYAHRNPADNDSRTDNPIKPSEIKFAKGWNREKWLDFLDVWKNHHLNDMNAGTPKQEKALKEWRAKNKISGWAYDEEVKHLKSIHLYDDDGYKYGTKWLRREVPKEKLDFLKDLPDTDKEPAWV